MNDVVILKPKNDIIFKLFFGDERNNELLKDFLKSILDLPDDDYDKITIVDPHLLREYPNDKMGILDVKLTSKTGKIINIEIQISPISMFKNRIVYYQAKMITEQVGKNNDYGKIKRVINIVITDFDIIHESPKYHHRFLQYDPENNISFTDLTETHTLELSKLPDDFDGTALCDWLKFLAAEKEVDFDMVAERNPEIKKAVVRIKELSADERARMLYEARELEQMDNRIRLRDARREGIMEGTIQIAKKFILRGRPIDEIIDYTGLTVDEIKNLQDS